MTPTFIIISLLALMLTGCHEKTKQGYGPPPDKNCQVGDMYIDLNNGSLYSCWTEIRTWSAPKAYQDYKDSK